MTNPESDLPTQTSSSGSPARGLSYLYMAAAFVIVVAGMRAASSVLNPLLLALFLSIVCAPIYLTLLKRGISNWLALAIVIGVLSFVVFSVVFVVMESVAGFTSRQAYYQQLLDQKTEILQTQINEWLPEWTQPKQESEGDRQEQGEANSAEKNSKSTQSELDATNTRAEDDAGDASTNRAASGQAVNEAEQQVRNSGSNLTKNAATESDEDSPESPQESNNGEANETPQPQQLVESRSDTIGFGSDEPLPETEQNWRDYISEQFNPGAALSMAARVARSIGQILSNAFLILLTVVFVLLEMSTFADKMKVAFAGARDPEGRGQQIIESIHNYVVIKTSVSLATGFLVAIWLNILGVPYSGLWGLVAFLFNFIPNVGSIIAAIPAVLIAWLELTLLNTILCAFGLLVINAAIGNLIEPRLMGRGLGLSPLVVFCSMVFWGWVLGPIGMVLSVPLTMTARIVLEGFEDTRWIGVLMGPGGESRT